MIICETCRNCLSHHIGITGAYVYKCSKSGNVTIPMLKAWGGTDSCPDFIDVDEVDYES